MAGGIDLSAHKDELSRLYKTSSTTDELVHLLFTKHGISISKHTVKRKLKDWDVRKPRKRVLVEQQEGAGGLVKSLQQEWRPDEDPHHISPNALPLPSQRILVDPDIFAILCPENDLTRRCIRMPANKTRYVGPENVNTEIGSRDSTPAPGVLACVDRNYLVLRFSDTERNGWTIGRNASCDIVLPAHGVSRLHCCIFAEDGGVYIEDCSTYGTSVAFDGDTPVLQKYKKWAIASKPGDPRMWDLLMLRVGDIDMSALLPNHHSGDPTYLENLEKFTQAGEGALPAMAGLGLVSLSSTVALGSPNHMQPDIFRQDPSLFAPSTDSESTNHEARDGAIVDVIGQCTDLNAGMVRASRSDGPSLAIEGAMPSISSDIMHLQPLQEVHLSGENGWDYQLLKRTDVAGLESTKKDHLQLQTTGGRPDSEHHTSWQNGALIKDDELGLMQIILDGRVVSMRLSDGFVSASDIMTFAGLIGKDERRARIHRKMAKSAPGRHYEKSTCQTWVSFTDGYFLCEYLGLIEALSSLIDYGKNKAMLQSDQRNYLLDLK